MDGAHTDPHDYEERFRRAGLPLLVEGRAAATDVFNRAFPFLALVFLAEIFGGLNLDWGLAANLAAIAGSLAIVLTGVALVNRMRGRPALAIPESLGPPELAAFVVLPAVLPLVFGGQVPSALLTAGGNLLLLGLVFGVLGLGLVSIVRWAGRRLVGQLARSALLLARAIPLLLLFGVVLFINAEMWQVFGAMRTASLVAIVVLLVGVGTLFVLGRIPREVRRMETEVAAGGPALARRQVVNLGLVLFVSQALQVLVVSLATAAFFVAFGLLAIPDPTIESWVGVAPDRLVTLDALGVEVRVSVELLRVATAIAAFSGLYYSIAVLTDATYREEFLDEVTAEMRATFALRPAYLAARASNVRRVG